MSDPKPWTPVPLADSTRLPVKEVERASRPLACQPGPLAARCATFMSNVCAWCHACCVNLLSWTSAIQAPCVSEAIDGQLIASELELADEEAVEATPSLALCPSLRVRGMATSVAGGVCRWLCSSHFAGGVSSELVLLGSVAGTRRRQRRREEGEAKEAEPTHERST